MEELTVTDYNDSMLDGMMELFYDTVHIVNAHDYRQDQLNRWAPKNTDKRFWQARLNKNVCKVAFFNQQLVGYTELVEKGHVDSLYVHKDFQRQKVATTLMEAIFQVAKEKHLSILTTESSITAKPFFEAFGFKVTKIKKKLYNGKDFTNYKMTKEL